MRFSAGTVANAVAWAVVMLLAGVAVLVADLLGFVGLMLLGGLTWLLCLRAAMNQDVPTWEVEVFRARMDGRRSPEQDAATAAEYQAFMSPLRFYGRCGMVLAGIGLAGFVWQRWWQ